MKKVQKKLKRMIKARKKTCKVSLPSLPFCCSFVAKGRFYAVLAIFYVTRAVLPVNCIKGKIIKKKKKEQLKTTIKARNISYEVSLPIFRSCFAVYGPFHAVLANFFVKRAVLPVNCPLAPNAFFNHKVTPHALQRKSPNQR